MWSLDGAGAEVRTLSCIGFHRNPTPRKPQRNEFRHRFLTLPRKNFNGQVKSQDRGFRRIFPRWMQTGIVISQPSEVFSNCLVRQFTQVPVSTRKSEGGIPRREKSMRLSWKKTAISLVVIIVAGIVARLAYDRGYARGGSAASVRLSKTFIDSPEKFLAEARLWCMVDTYEGYELLGISAANSEANKRMYEKTDQDCAAKVAQAKARLVLAQ